MQSAGPTDLSVLLHSADSQVRGIINTITGIDLSRINNINDHVDCYTLISSLFGNIAHANMELIQNFAVHPHNVDPSILQANPQSLFRILESAMLTDIEQRDKQLEADVSEAVGADQVKSALHRRKKLHSKALEAYNMLLEQKEARNLRWDQQRKASELRSAEPVQPQLRGAAVPARVIDEFLLVRQSLFGTPHEFLGIPREVSDLVISRLGMDGALDFFRTRVGEVIKCLRQSDWQRQLDKLLTHHLQRGNM